MTLAVSCKSRSCMKADDAEMSNSEQATQTVANKRLIILKTCDTSSLELRS